MKANDGLGLLALSLFPELSFVYADMQHAAFCKALLKIVGERNDGS